VSAALLATPSYAKHKHHRHHKPAVVKKHSVPRTINNISTWAYDINNDVTLQGNGVAVKRPMASLTKLMTAMVSLDNDSNLDHRYGSQSRETLFRALLVRSNNEAAETLARNYPGGRTAFLDAMNHKAVTLGMLDTHFDDPSGRISTNVSTAQDVGHMLMAASRYSEIRRISTYQHLEHTRTVKAKRHTKTVHVIENNTNVMVLQAFPDIVVSKTGFTNPAGYCVGVVIEQGSNRYAVVVMGARNRYDRFDHVKEIMHNSIMTNGHQHRNGRQQVASIN
jgi:D-alanyl-D-alanine endopeptidase (penicillin-binding protein 7)